MKYTSPLWSFGGKSRMLRYLLPMIPPHTIYVEVFGGAANLLFAKPPSEVEVYNDIDESLVTFFRVLRDPEKSLELMRRLILTPYSRREFEEAKRIIDEGLGDDVERARAIYVLSMQSFAARGGNWGYKFSRRGGKIDHFFNRFIFLPFFHERIRNVQIECDDFENVIKRYDGETTFFYLDPPYIDAKGKAERVGRGWMKLEDHERLVDVLLSIKGKALLSGYYHPVYEPLTKNGWHMKKIKIRTHMPRKRRSERIECLWWNYEINAKISKTSTGRAK